MSIFKDQFPRIGASGQSTGYTIDQSIRFNDDDSSLMSRTPSQASSSQRAFTISFWTKRGNLTSGNRGLFAWEGADDNSELRLYFDDNQLRYSYIDSNSYVSRLDTIKLFRDVSAWYHIVAVSDTENAVATERWKIYVNGVRETAFESTVYPSQNANIALFSSTSYLTVIGRTRSAGTSTYDGYLSEINVIDGYAYDPSYFGEFKTNTDIWIPKKYEGSYGNNGFYLKGQNSGALGNDSSGNDNDFSVTGLAAHDQVLDSPTNNFCVMSSIDFTYNAIRNGNLETIGGNNNKGGRGTFGFSSGKFYWEMLATTVSDGYPGSGVVYDEYASSMPTAYAGGGTNHGAGASHNQAIWYKQSTSGSTYGSIASSGDILQYAVDRDNNKIYWGVNGTYRNSGDPAGGSGAVASSLTHYGDWMPYVNHGSNAGSSAGTFNFGQDGTFAGAKTAQGNSDGNGIGNFYYSPPTGFLALCSLNLGS